LPSVYIETSIPSCLTAWPMTNLVAAAHQELTRIWWEQRRTQFDLFISELVIAEASAGDPDAAKRRLEAIAGIPLLPINDAVQLIADELAARGLVPPRATADALHIGLASVHRLDYLLTWNCKHIANAERLPAIEDYLEHGGHFVPNVCTPEELMGDVDSFGQ
jgi:predicted nucleic acid-binding protein